MIIEILHLIFPYVVILYIIDSLQYIKKPVILFVSHFGKKFHLKTGGLHVTKISPVSASVISQDIPVFLAVNGVYKIDPEGWHNPAIFNEQHVIFISYQDIKRLHVDGKDVNINSNISIKTASPTAANIIKHQIEVIRTVAPAMRKEKIKENMASALNTEEMAKKNRRHAPDLLILKLLGTFFFFNTFMILPLILYADFYLHVNVYLIVAYIGGAYVIILSCTLFVHKKIYKNEKKQRLHVALSMLFSPFSAAHASHYVSRDLFSQFDYLAIARTLLPTDIFLNVARKELALVDLRKNLVADPEWLAYWQTRADVIKNFLIKSGCSFRMALSPPVKKDAAASGYCPLCQAEYVGAKEYCSDCNVKLKKF